MPDNPTNPSPPVKAARDPNAPKYTPEQRQKAEEKVQANAAAQAQKLNDFVDKFSTQLVEFLEKEDVNTRTSVVDRIVDRVRSIRNVAANAHLSATRSFVRKEEDVSMPRVITGESRNIMAQADQNQTDVNSGGKKQ